MATTIPFADSPQFEVEPSDVMVSLGQQAAFECSVRNQAIQVDWLKDEQPLALDHRMKILPSGLLEISDVKISDHGHYRCRAETKRSRGATLKLKLDGGMINYLPFFNASVMTKQ